MKVQVITGKRLLMRRLGVVGLRLLRPILLSGDPSFLNGQAAGRDGIDLLLLVVVEKIYPFRTSSSHLQISDRLNLLDVMALFQARGPRNEGGSNQKPRYTSANPDKSLDLSSSSLLFSYLLLTQLFRVPSSRVLPSPSLWISAVWSESLMVSLSDSVSGTGESQNHVLDCYRH